LTRCVFLNYSLTTRGTVALTSPLAKSSPPDTLCSTSRISPTPPPLLLLIVSPRPKNPGRLLGHHGMLFRCCHVGSRARAGVSERTWPSRA
jgi:hypothetical protein